VDRRFCRLASLVLAPLALVLICAPSAAADGFWAEDYPATVTGEQKSESVVLGTEAGSVSCKSSTLTSTLSEQSSTLTLAPTFSECKAFGFLSATVTTTGCSFVLQEAEETALDKFEGAMDISCEAGKAIVITASTCEAQISGQSGLKTMTYANNPGAATPNFSATFALSGIKYTVTKDGFACPFAGTGAKSGGTFSEEATLKASKEGVEQQVQVRPPTVLCIAEPAGNPLVCPANKEFFTKSMSATLVNPPATWSGEGIVISCGNSAMSLELIWAGSSPLGGGVTAWSFSTGGGECTSNFAGTPTVAVAVENLSFDSTRADYKLGAGSQGRLSIVKRNNIPVQLKMTIKLAGPPICQYQPTSGLVALWVNGTGKGTSTLEFVNQAFSLTAGGAPCPATLSFNAAYSVTNPKGGTVYIAS
jgi:hypothetical protein